MKNLIKIFGFTLFIYSTAFNNGKVSAKKQELEKLRNEIYGLQSELGQKRKIERQSIEDIEKYNKQNFLLSQLIYKLKDEEKSKEVQIIEIELNIQALEKDIATLKDSYSKYVQWLYKQGKNVDVILLLNSKSLDNGVLRYKYLNKITTQRKNDLQRLKQNKSRLEQLRKQLTNERTEKQQLAVQKLSEENQLKQQIENKKDLLFKLRKDKLSLQKELSMKKTAQNKIQNLISRLITRESNNVASNKSTKPKNETETKPNIKERNNTPKEKNDQAQNNFSGHGISSGSGWPVSGKIVRKYGENINDKLNTVTLNYGVDIKTNGGSSVTNIDEGKVSAIEFIPGYGAVVIVSHGRGFRSVYARLTNIAVSEGQHVSKNSVIGKVDESLDGHILHFEIWNERKSLNPESYLARR